VICYERVIVYTVRYSLLATIVVMSGFIYGNDSCDYECAGRDVLLEFKGAYFLPTDHNFRHIYGGGALFGPEVTFEFFNQVYGFMSIDFLQKDGFSLGGCFPTQITLVPIGMGFKYFVPFCYGDFYVGIGLQSTVVQITNCSPNVLPEQSQWGFGGIAKIGTIFDLPCNLFIDIFIDYSFLSVSFNNCCQTNPAAAQKAHVSGTIFGVSLGYRF
jgi:hypothetical protein